MEGIVLVDTCVLFDFMAGKMNGSKIENLLLNSQAAISVITIYELFRGVISNDHVRQRQDLVGLCKVIDLTEPVSRKAADIYSGLRQKGLASASRLHRDGAGCLIPNQDILIAATALHWKYPLLTTNKKDFQNIPKIQLF